MDIIRVFGTNLRRYRKELGLSQEAFAGKCGMHRTYIGAIECFRRSIALENIQRIADALGIEAYKLLMEQSDNGRN
ncbi:MAG: helix-turn-helix transcriptional regulator [Oscillospiraceae bacterium]|nr:helix-turn-helix transcriptional regulator [Oscillospiraceae bacterium]